ncbi:MAG: hypothetical protein ACOY0T_08260 [Myxococcota bacterium]
MQALLSTRAPVSCLAVAILSLFTARPALAEATSANASSSSGSGAGSGPFGPVRIGPLVGVGLPNMLSFGATSKITPYVGAGFNVGIIPTMRLAYYGEATLVYREYDIYGRIYPFGGGFFLGTGIGYEQVRGTLQGSVDLTQYSIPPGVVPEGYALPNAITYQSRGLVRSMVLTPQLGYLHLFDFGFTLGVDVGAQIPVASSKVEFESDVKPAELRQLPPFREEEAKVRDTLERVGRVPIPTLNVRAGWLF